METLNKKYKVADQFNMLLLRVIRRQCQSMGIIQSEWFQQCNFELVIEFLVAYSSTLLAFKAGTIPVTKKQIRNTDL
jgi:hypothetical protein